MSSLLSLIREDYRRKQLTKQELKLEDVLKDIAANPVKFSVASSLTDDRQWLHFVCQQGAPEPALKLIEAGADIHSRDAIERTPLHHAAFGRTDDAADCCRILLDAGSEPNSIDCMGYTALHMAAMAENAASITVLGQRQADLNARGPSGFTALHMLAQSETGIAALDALLRLGAETNVYDECQRTPMDIARERGAFRVLKKLHGTINTGAQAKYLFRDEARDVGEAFAKRRVSLKSALPQLMLAVATGKNPTDAATPWAGKNSVTASRVGALPPGVVDDVVATSHRKPREGGEHGANEYWEEETSSEEEISKFTGVAVFNKDKKPKHKKAVVPPVDPSAVGNERYDRAQADRDAALLADDGTGGAAAGAGWGGEEYDDVDG